MPQKYQNYITVDMKISVRQKPNGVYEARYRAHGLNICVAAKEHSKLKSKFLSKLVETASAGELAPKADRITVSEMCRRWLELRRPTIKDDTAKEYARMIAADVDPTIGKMPLAKVRQSDLQEFVSAPMAAGHGRTAEARRSPLPRKRSCCKCSTDSRGSPAPCTTRCSFCSTRGCGEANFPASASRTAFSRSAAGRCAKGNEKKYVSYPSHPCWPPFCPSSTSKASAPCVRMRSLRRCTVSCRSTICTISGTPTSRAVRSAMCRAKLFPPGQAMRRTVR